MTIKPKISVIIPVYNVEKWLNKCIDSILEQTYDNLEIILVNDGSTDRSAKICAEYSILDTRIKIIHIKNSGQSVARNKGIDIARGKYLLFIDSDDYLCDKNVFEKFINILEKNKCDFIYTSYCRFNDGNEGNIIEILPIKLSNNDIKNKQGEEILVDLINKNSFHHAPYLKICRKDFILNNSLYFREGYYHEDVEWSFKVFYYAKKISIYNEKWYMRRMREGSTITSIDEENTTKKICDRLNISNKLICFFKELEDSQSKNIIINDLVRMYWGDLMCTSKINLKDNMYTCSNTINNTKVVLDNSNNKKYKIAKVLINILGSNNFIKLLKLIS